MSALPLEGIRVLDLTRLVPGNYCCWLLASLGAEVIKIEDPGAGDYMREVGDKIGDMSGTNHLVNRGKRSAVVDLKSAEGREAFMRLTDRADVVVESFRSGVLDRLGVGERALRARNPRLVVVSISGYGATGPLGGVGAHDINAAAFSGVLRTLTHNAEGVPEPPATPFADIIGGSLFPAIGILALIIQARATGKGGWLDASLAEGLALLPGVGIGNMLVGADPPPPGTPEAAGFAHYRVYKLADGQVSVGAFEPQFWTVLCTLLELPQLIPAHLDPTAQPEAERILTERFAAMTRGQFEELTAGQDVCCHVVLDFKEMIGTPQAQARSFTRPAPDVDMDVLAPPFVIDGVRPSETIGSPRQGEHTEQVLAEFGFADGEISDLVASGAVGLPSRRTASA